MAAATPSSNEGSTLNSWKQALLIVVAATWVLVYVYSVSDADGADFDFSDARRVPIPRRFYEDEDNGVEEQQDSDGLEGLKTILYFTPFFDMTDWEFGYGRQPFLKYNCPVNTCYATNNRTLAGSISNFDAVLFHMRDLNAENGAGRVLVPSQRKRRADQRYVMFLMESPIHDSFRYDKFGGFFNWTMTYRLDSDIPRPYGWMVDKALTGFQYPPALAEAGRWRDFDPSEFARSLPRRGEAFRRLAHRPKIVAWIVSNCRSTSRREDYVKELRKYIDVDVFGGCSRSRQCDVSYTKSRNGGNDSCTKQVEDNYKFYLSFENSLCDHYVTEKFFNRIKKNVVPIVMGGSNYSRVAPPHSYINVADFNSPQELARFLLKLNSSENAYLSYFWWKDFYTVRGDSLADKAASMCQLCAKLNDVAEPTKVYENMTSWWRGGGSCKESGEVPWAKPEPAWFVKALTDPIKGMLGQNMLF